MMQEQLGVKRISGIGVVAAFGFMTMSSSIFPQSLTTVNNVPFFYHENNMNYQTDSMDATLLSGPSMADGNLLAEKSLDVVQNHKRLAVNLKITKLTKHVSNFDFDEEYEEI